MRYRGRFAPSPTGPLHLGSLLAATGSYLQARSNHGDWLIRIEDIDPPREQAGASDAILKTLEHLGFEWDEEVLFQSTRRDAYQAIIEKLLKEGAAYYCRCSRKDIAAIAQNGPNGPIYPRTCLRSVPAFNKGSIRFQTTDKQIQFVDALQGLISQRVSDDSGDFVIQRADGLFAYQLAVVIDDEDQKITHIVRGSDLLSLTPGQINLQQTLGFATPEYTHLPVITNTQGHKLSKQTGAAGIDLKQGNRQLWQCLHLLNQQPPEELYNDSLNSIWAWAIQNWDISKIPHKEQIQLP